MSPPRSDQVQLLVIAKAPEPGRVKTRLCPPFNPQQAAALAAAALTDTLAAVAGAPAAARTVALDGAAGPWIPAGFAVIPQRGAGLDERLAGAFTDAWRLHPGPMLLIGMDTPQVTSTLLAGCAARLCRPRTDAVLGFAADGGWWGLGLRRPDPGLLRGVPMSSPRTGSAQLRRLQTAGLRVSALPTLTDVDTAGDAYAVAARCPRSRFAAALHAMASAS